MRSLSKVGGTALKCFFLFLFFFFTLSLSFPCQDHNRHHLRNR